MIQIGKYRIEGELGRGAMGIVYQAFDPVVERHVAIKTIRFDDSSGADRLELLKREAKSVGRFEHPNIVTLYDAGETDGLFYMVMQLVQGETLRESISRQRWYKVPRIVDLFRQILEGLGYAHDHGVVHRDIKPANIMITSDGAVKLADFGVSKLIGPGISDSGLVVGTPSYMSPEQVLGRAVDARSDLFSLGCTLYEVLTGERAFPGDSATAVMYNIVHGAPAPPASLRPGIDPGLQEIVLKALANDPDDRFANCKEMSRALEDCMAGYAKLTPRAAASSGVATPVQIIGSEPRAAVVQSGPRRSRRLGFLRPRWIAAVVATIAVFALCGVLLRRSTISSTRPAASSMQPPAPVINNAQSQQHAEVPPRAQPVESPPIPLAAPDVSSETAIRRPARVPSAAQPRLPIREAPPPAVAVSADFHAPTQPSRYPASEENDFGALLLEGDVAFQRNAYDNALSAYAKAYQLNPRDAAVRRKLVVVLTLLDRAMEAQKYRR